MSDYCRCGHADGSHLPKCKACECAAFQPRMSRQQMRAATRTNEKVTKRVTKTVMRLAAVAVKHGTDSPEYGRAIQRMTQKDRDAILSRIRKDRT